MTGEQRMQEAAFSAQICEAEIEAVRNITGAETGPDSLFKIIDNASGFAEMVAKKIRSPATPPVACKEGCSWCCHQTVRVTAPEAFLIARFISSLADLGLRTIIEDALRKLDMQTRGLTPKARAILRTPCAFLKEDRCTIYAIRPLACAEFTSFNVNDCKKGYRVGFKPKSVIHEKARMVAYYAVRDGLILGLRESLPGVDNADLELTAAVVDALDSPQSARDWLEGKGVFTNAHLKQDQ
jgi:Fe-S-cluster containining protein